MDKGKRGRVPLPHTGPAGGEIRCLQSVLFVQMNYCPHDLSAVSYRFLNVNWTENDTKTELFYLYASALCNIHI